MQRDLQKKFCRDGALKEKRVIEYLKYNLRYEFISEYLDICIAVAAAAAAAKKKNLCGGKMSMNLALIILC